MSYHMGGCCTLHWHIFQSCRHNRAPINFLRALVCTQLLVITAGNIVSCGSQSLPNFLANNYDNYIFWLIGESQLSTAGCWWVSSWLVFFPRPSTRRQRKKYPSKTSEVLGPFYTWTGHGALVQFHEEFPIFMKFPIHTWHGALVPFQ